MPTPEDFMRRALALARRAGHAPSPNPRVGAVVVRGGRVVGEGSHRRWGGPHAEAVALRRAGSRARGAALYVTLEPCDHEGKTPSCTEAILRAGVARVVAAAADPDPRVRGAGLRRLRALGVGVSLGLLEREARALNPDFHFAHARGRPWVVLKAAVSLDGRIAAEGGRSRWITGLPARREARRLRAASDAVLVGVRTVLADDPRLDLRGVGIRRFGGFPLRVVLDGRLRTPPGARILRGGQRTVLFTSPGASRAREGRLRRLGAEVVRVPPDRRGGLSLRAVLRELHRREVRRVLVEGGAAVHTAFREAGLADEVVLFLAPRILGGARAPAWIGGRGVRSPSRAPLMRDFRVARVGRDVRLSGRF